MGGRVVAAVLAVLVEREVVGPSPETLVLKLYRSS